MIIAFHHVTFFHFFQYSVYSMYVVCMVLTFLQTIPEFILNRQWPSKGSVHTLSTFKFVLTISNMTKHKTISTVKTDFLLGWLKCTDYITSKAAHFMVQFINRFILGGLHDLRYKKKDKEVLFSPGDFLFQRSRVWWVELDSQAHGEWRLSWWNNTNNVVFLMKLNYWQFMFCFQRRQTDILTLHLFGDWFAKLQPVLKDERRRGMCLG